MNHEIQRVFVIMVFQMKMASLDPECNDLKQKYDDCFNYWFARKFLNGEKDLSMCDDLMKEYSKCVKVADF